MLRYQQRVMSRVFHSTWMRYLSLMALRRAREAAGSQLVEMSNRGRQKHSPKSVLVWHLRQHGHQNPKQPDRRQTDQVTHTHMHTHGNTHTHTHTHIKYTHRSSCHHNSHRCCCSTPQSLCQQGTEKCLAVCSLQASAGLPSLWIYRGQCKSKALPEICPGNMELSYMRNWK